MRKSIVIIFSAFVLLTGMIACNGSQNSSHPETTSSDETETTTTGGEPSESGTATPTADAPAEIQPGTFSDFMALFKTDSTFQNWPQIGFYPLVAKSGSLEQAMSNDPGVSSAFTRIGPEFYSFVPVTPIRQFDSLETPIEDPLKSFNFYAFRKMEQEQYWLVSIFALKLDRNYNGEFFAHPFYLATLSPEGDFIDGYAWAWMVDDMWEGNSEIAVEGETLLDGAKENYEDSQLSEIWAKTIISPEGKFINTYSNFPKEE